MGKYERMQADLAARRADDECRKARDSILAEKSRQQEAAAAAEDQRKFSEVHEVARYIAKTLVARGNEGDFSVTGTQERRWGSPRRWRIASGWVLSSWQVGPTFESMQSASGTAELAHYEGTVLASDGDFYRAGQDGSPGTPRLRPMNFYHAADGRPILNMGLKFEEIRNYRELKASPNIEMALATFAFDNDVSLAGF